MKFKTIAVLLCSTVLVSACMPANTSVDSVVKGKERSGGLFGMVKQDDIKVDTAAAFKDVKDVVVGNFVVGFATLKTDSAKAGGVSSFGGRSSAKSTLIGIDNSTMQKITDKAYSQFVADLKSKGYNVIDRSALANSEKFKTSKTYENGYEDSSGGLFGASSKTKYYSPSSFGALRAFMGDIPGFTGGFGFDNPIHAVTEYTKQSGVKVLSMVYVLDFANADTYGGWGTSSSSVNVGQGMTVVPEFTKLTIIGGEGGTFSSAIGNVRLGQPITSEKAFGEIKNTNSEGYKALEMASNVVGILGGVGSNVSREYEVTAKPVAYSDASLDVIGKANAALVEKAASLK